MLKALNILSHLKFCFHGLQHQILGGLTSARLMVIWGGVGDSKTIKLAAKICNLSVLVNYLNLMLGIILE